MRHERVLVFYLRVRTVARGVPETGLSNKPAFFSVSVSDRFPVGVVWFLQIV